MTRAEDDWRAVGRRLEHRVQPGRMESAADEGEISQSIEVAEHPNGVDENDVG